MAWGGAAVVTLIRPQAAALVSQVGFVRAYADQRADRGVEVMGQMGIWRFLRHCPGPDRDPQPAALRADRAGADHRRQCLDAAQAHACGAAPRRSRRPDPADDRYARPRQLSQRPCDPGPCHRHGARRDARASRRQLSRPRRPAAPDAEDGPPDRRQPHRRRGALPDRQLGRGDDRRPGRPDDPGALPRRRPRPGADLRRERPWRQRFPLRRCRRCCIPIRSRRPAGDIAATTASAGSGPSAGPNLPGRRPRRRR